MLIKCIDKQLKEENVFKTKEYNNSSIIHQSNERLLPVFNYSSDKRNGIKRTCRWKWIDKQLKDEKKLKADSLRSYNKSNHSSIKWNKYI